MRVLGFLVVCVPWSVIVMFAWSLLRAGRKPVPRPRTKTVGLECWRKFSQ